ncbi:amidohydrolase family protein [Haloarchaeobius sp. DFWS5]|uniref:amidohydrolase family protein n=1 Tax=Haloarchaeobius sp. DFWS5 TaxID=3446114 RepID=UPI003EBE50F3
MSDHTVIDIWCNLFTKAGIDTFSDSAARETAAKLFNKDEMFKPGTEQTPDEFVAKMDDEGVDMVFIPALKFGNPDGGMEMDVPYEAVRDACEQYPDRLKGMAGINPREGMDGVRKLERYVEDHDFIAGHLEPYGWDRPVNHRQYYPFYAKCAELGVPVVMQVGHSAIQMPSKHGKPLLVDDIALDFPELDIVAAHTGWPWSKELEALAWKHPNVYIGTSGHLPRYWDDNLVAFLRSRGRDKMLFGTDYPVFDYPRGLEQVAELELDDEVERKLLGGNAMRVFDV